MSLEAIVEELHGRVGASRTTLRLDRPDVVFPVVAEALAPGVRSIRNDATIDLARAPTYRYLEAERRILVQDDCAADDPPPPQELLDLYGVRAQMLAPIEREGRLAGIVSVHYAPGPREWSDEDVAALEEAAERIRRELERADT